MATMTIRTTVAFDPATVARWERLAKRWGVSKSEALRRAIEAADTPQNPPSQGAPLDPARVAKMSPAQALAWIAQHGLVSPGAGQAWREQLRETRDDFAARP